MGILGRLTTLIKSNVNDAIDSMQDPGKEIDQMVRDMEDSARQARAEVAQCLADEKRQSKRVEALTVESKTWEEHAMRAVQAGDDELAGRTPASAEAERKLRDMSEQSSVDDALAELKKKLQG